MNSSCELFWTESDMEDLMRTSIEIGDARITRIQAFVTFNRRDPLLNSTTLEQFFLESKIGNKTVAITRVTLEDDQIVNERETVKFKQGRLVT
jgi:hypothetical protein